MAKIKGQCQVKGKNKNCEVCNCEFYVYPYAFKTRKYCSNKCKKIAYQKNHPRKGKYKISKFIKCKFCGKEFLQRGKVERIYCSLYCYKKGGKTQFNRNKLLDTRKETKKITKELFNKIQNKGNRAIIVDKKPRPDIIEVDFDNRKIIAHEIETNERLFHKRKIIPYIEQFVKKGLTYDLILVIDKRNTKKVWQKFPIKVTNNHNV